MRKKTQQPPECPNVLELAKLRRWRTGLDPAAGKRCSDPWMQTIRCKFGTIYPTGPGRLRVDIDGHNRIAKRVGAVEGCRLVQDGDTEKTYEFPVALLDAVAQVVLPYRKRKLSEEQLQRLRANSPFKRKPHSQAVPEILTPPQPA